jgi:zinc/manganese transport system substrate-binding protein
MRRLLAVLVLLSSVLLAVACSDGGGDDGSGRLRVVASTTQIGDFASRVGGDHIQLTVLLKAGQDAHDFEPQPSQVRAISQARLVLLNGLGLDEFAEDAVESSGSKTVTVSEGIAPRGSDEEEHGEGDPHVWFSVVNARVMVANIRDAFAEADPANSSAYQQAADGYLAELARLDTNIRQQVAAVAPACRKLVTNHDVLGYYAEAYGFEVVGSVIPATTTEARPSASQVADIVAKVRAEKVPAIFAEAEANPDLVRQVAREADVKVVDDLYGDSLGDEGSDGETYVKMMEANTSKIVDALEGCRP